MARYIDEAEVFLPHILKHLVQEYKGDSGDFLETAVESGSFNDIYSCYKLLNSHGFESNYMLVAANITAIYFELNENYKDRIGDTHSMFVLTGLIDSSRYIDGGLISVQEIMDIVDELSENNELSLTDLTVRLLVLFNNIHRQQGILPMPITEEEILGCCEGERHQIKRYIESIDPADVRNKGNIADGVADFMSNQTVF